MKTPTWQTKAGQNSGCYIMARWRNLTHSLFGEKMTCLLRFVQNVKTASLFLIFMFMAFAKMVLLDIGHIANNVVGLRKEKIKLGQFIRKYLLLGSKCVHHVNCINLCQISTLMAVLAMAQKNIGQSVNTVFWSLPKNNIQLITRQNAKKDHLLLKTLFHQFCITQHKENSILASILIFFTWLTYTTNNKENALFLELK